MFIWLGRRRCRAHDDEGTSIVEISVASMVILVGVLGVIASLTSGMSMIGHSRQRSSGAAVAQERIERVRNYDNFESVALYEQPTHNNTTSHPDNAVNASNTKFQVDASHNEPLIVQSDGALKHIDDPITIGQTEFVVYQYVTWVDDVTITKERASCPLVDKKACDYKRVVVIVLWKFPVSAGEANSVTESTFVTDGTVSLPEEGPLGGPGASALPPPSVSPPAIIGDLLGIGQRILPPPAQQPNPSGPCPNDTQGPNEPQPPSTPATLQVVSGATGADLGYVNNHSAVALQVKATDTCTTPATTGNPNPNDIVVFLSNCANAAPPAPTPSAEPSPTPIASVVPTATPTPCDYTQVSKLENGVSGTVSWTIPAGDGRRRIYAVFKDGNGMVSGTYAVDVILDETKPSVPPNLRKTSVSCTGNIRTLAMAWDAASDTNFVGYRYYIKNGSTYTNPNAPNTNTTSSLTASVQSGRNDVVTYVVRAYDRAGNESLDSNTINLVKKEGTGC